MSFDYINEAFKRLDALNEDVFDTSLTGLNNLSDFMDQDDASDIVKVIDPTAETDDAVSDSYIGKVIINCNVCHSHIFESKEDVVIDEDGVVNPEMQCPYCGEVAGFTVVGEIKPFEQSTEAPESEVNTDTSAETEAQEPTEDPVVESADKKLDEGFNFDTVMSDIETLKGFLRSKGHACKSKEAITYLWSVIDLFEAGDQELSLENIAEWYEETCRNFPEDLELLEEINSDLAEGKEDFVWVVKDEFGEYVCSFPADREGAARAEAKKMWKATVEKVAVTEGLLGGDVNIKVNGSNSAVGFLGGSANTVNNEGLVGDLNIDLDASKSSVGFMNGNAGTQNNESITEEDDELEEGIFDKFKKKKQEVPAEEPKKEEPKKEEEAFTTYSYDEWILALEYGHKYYAEDGPTAGRMKLWDKAIEIAACKNLARDVIACMDAWMKHEGSNNFPHKSYAKHLEEGLFGLGKKKKKAAATKATTTSSKPTKKEIPDGWVIGKKEKIGSSFSWVDMENKVYYDYDGCKAAADRKTQLAGIKDWKYEPISCSAAVNVFGERRAWFNEDLIESIDELSLTANGTHIEVDEDENGKVTLVAEPVETEGDAAIAPVSDDTMSEIAANNDIDVEDPEAEEVPEDEIDVDLDEVDEEGLDELGESYLKNIYENVESFKTTCVSTTDSKMIVEGVITFQSGVKKNTGFVFEAYSASKDGKVKFVGKNEHFSPNSRAFALTGTISNNKLLPESLTYNYQVGSRKIVGTVNKQ